MHCKIDASSNSPTDYSVAPPEHNIELPAHSLYLSSLRSWLGLGYQQAALCDVGDAVMCGGGYVTLVTDWCCAFCSGGYVNGDKPVLCSGGYMTGDRLVLCDV